MTTALSHKSSTSRLTIVAMCAAAALACLAVPAASVAADGRTDGTYRASEWAQTGDLAAANSPTLTNGVGDLDDNAGSQLPLGLGLLGAGVVGLACGLALLARARPADLVSAAKPSASLIQYARRSP